MRLAGAILPIGTNLKPDVIQAKAEGKIRAESMLAIHGFANSVVGSMLEKASNQIDGSLGLCESPIEEIMLCGLGYMTVPRAECFPVAIHDVQSGEFWPNCPVVVVPQFAIARYRLDFLVSITTANGKQLLAVECDGKDFHTDRAAMQRDKERDAYLACLGVETLRYSGNWIKRNYLNVADEINAIVNRVVA